MKLGSQIKENIEYGGKLVGSGVEGAAEVTRRYLHDEEIIDQLADAAQESWRPALAGVVVGALVSFLTDEEKSARSILLGGLVGGALGFTGGMAWNSRQLTQEVARGAARKINRARDEHWLEHNPVVYG
jgi:hypothetical protein